MDINSFLMALQGLGLSQYIQISAWAFPVIESLHVVGVAVLFGTILVVDLRLLGTTALSRRVSEISRDCLHLTWAGFILALVTGLLMFISNAQTYWDNDWFRWKLLFIGLAGVNMLLLEFVTARSMPIWDDGTVALPAAARLAGLLSITFWVAVIVCGRLIGFTLYALPF